jgi:hypothetical protein
MFWKKKKVTEITAPVPDEPRVRTVVFDADTLERAYRDVKHVGFSRSVMNSDNVLALLMLARMGLETVPGKVFTLSITTGAASLDSLADVAGVPQMRPATPSEVFEELHPPLS